MENKLKELRKALGLSQDELARAVSVTRQTVISLENGKYIASLPLAFHLARFFNVSIEEIFIFKEE